MPEDLLVLLLGLIGSLLAVGLAIHVAVSINSACCAPVPIGYALQPIPVVQAVPPIVVNNKTT